MASQPGVGALQPLAVQLLKGADKKDPKRYAERKNSVQPTKPIGMAPRWLSVSAQEIWEEVKGEVVRGVLTHQDRQAFAVFCSLMADFRVPSEHPAWANGQFARGAKLVQMAAQFGMTPLSRQKVAAPKGDDNPESFGEFSSN